VTKLVAAAKQQDVVLRALTIYGELGDSWRGLSMVLDAIQQDAGGEDDLLDAGWAPRKDIKLFKQTANNYGAIGLDARHGYRGTPMRKKPISIVHARQLVRTLLTNWLASKGL
jgi:hypothetical protein